MKILQVRQIEKLDEHFQNDIAATKQNSILVLVPDYHTNLIHDPESLSILSMQ